MESVPGILDATDPARHGRLEAKPTDGQLHSHTLQRDRRAADAPRAPMSVRLQKKARLKREVRLYGMQQLAVGFVQLTG